MTEVKVRITIALLDDAGRVQAAGSNTTLTKYDVGGTADDASEEAAGIAASLTHDLMEGAGR